MKAKRMISLLVLLAILALPVGANSAPAGTVFTLTLEAPSISPEAGDQFTVEINADATTPIRGIQFDLAYDPAVLQLDSVEINQNVWINPNRVMTCQGPSGPVNITAEFTDPGAIDNVTGLLDAFVTAPLGVPVSYGCTGSGPIATLTFTVLARGLSVNDFPDVRVPGANGANLPAASPGVDGYEALADSILIPFKVFLPFANQN